MNLKKAETILSAIAGLGVLMHLGHIPGAGMLCVLGFASLSIVLFSGAYLPNKNTGEQPAFERFLSKLAPIIYAITALGILFKIQYWPGARPMLTVGSAGCLIILLMRLTQKSGPAPEGQEINDSMLKKALKPLLYFLIAGSLFLLPVKEQIKFQYRDDPEMARLKIQVVEHPNDTLYYDQLMEYRNKKYGNNTNDSIK